MRMGRLSFVWLLGFSCGLMFGAPAAFSDDAPTRAGSGNPAPATNLSREASLLPPEAILGFRLGDRAATPEQIERCLRSWSLASPRAMLAEYARSYEGRGLFALFISSEENLKRLGEIRAGWKMVADPRGNAGPALERLAAELPAVAWLGYSIHGDETSGGDAALAVAYHLISSRDAPVPGLLNDLVIVIDPMMNPDGRQRWLQQIAEQRSGVLDADDQSLLHEGYWPMGRGNHYLFDLNRDWIYGVHPETRGRLRLLLDWHPLIFVDAHEMGAQDSYLFSPSREPINGNLPARRRHWWAIFAREQAAAFDLRGWRYYTGEWNEEWYPGYSSSWSGYRGAVGILYEQAAVSDGAVRRPEGRLMTYRESVDHQAVSSMANLLSLRRHRGELAVEFLRERRLAVSDKGPYARRIFAVLPTPNQSRLRRFLDLMDLQGIEVFKAAADFQGLQAVDQLGRVLDRPTVPAGTLLIPNRQPEAHLLAAMLEFDPRMTDQFLTVERRKVIGEGRSLLYDTTAWNITMMFGLKAWELEADLPSSARRVGGGSQAGAVDRGSGSATVLEAEPRGGATRVSSAAAGPRAGNEAGLGQRATAHRPAGVGSGPGAKNQPAAEAVTQVAGAAEARSGQGRPTPVSPPDGIGQSPDSSMAAGTASARSSRRDPGRRDSGQASLAGPPTEPGVTRRGMGAAATSPSGPQIQKRSTKNQKSTENRVEKKVPVPAVIPEARQAWVIDGADDASVVAAARLMARGIEIRVAQRAFTFDGRDFSRGSVLVTREDNRRAEKVAVQVLEDLRKHLGVTVWAVNSGLGQGKGDVPDLGGEHFPLLERPRVGLFGRKGVSSTDFGAIWHLLDLSFRLPVALLDLESIAYLDLRRYNVLILPGQWWPRASKEELAPLKNWVEAGGTLLAVATSAASLAVPESELSGARELPDVLEKLDEYELALFREWEGRRAAVDAEKTWSRSPAAKVAYPWDAKVEARPSTQELKRRDGWQRRFSPQGAFLAGRIDDQHWLTFGCSTPLPVLFGRNPVLMAKESVEAPVRLGIFLPVPETKAQEKEEPSKKLKTPPDTEPTEGNEDQRKKTDPVKKKTPDNKRSRIGWAPVPAGQEMQLRMSGLLWPEAAHRLANAAVVTRESRGRGQVILFAVEPVFRGSTLATARIFVNAVIYGPGLGTDPVIEP